jgi:hypothetical protein
MIVPAHDPNVSRLKYNLGGFQRGMGLLESITSHSNRNWRARATAWVRLFTPSLA